MMAFTGYCAYVEINDRNDTIAKYSDDEMSSEAKKIKTYDDSNANNTASNIKIGSLVSDIVSITTSSYSVDMSLWFDFDQLDLHQTLCTLNNEVNAYEKRLTSRTDWDENTLRYTDVLTYSSNSSSFYSEPDGIPDFLETNMVNMASLDNFSNIYSAATPTQLVSLTLSPIFNIEQSCYPGQVQSNNYSDNSNMWGVERGGINADSFTYDFMTPYTLKNANKTSFRLFQKCAFTATINKKFDCPRYPLDSAQFHIYFYPKFTTSYFRYVPMEVVDLSLNQKLDGLDTVCSTFGTAEANLYKTGLSSSFRLSNGYKLIESKSVKGNIARLDYSATSNENGTYSNIKTHYEIVIRANREGISLFLQAFANLFAVVVWILIAFYDQSYNGENSIGMLGTGIFGVISSVLVGISIINDSNIFSLITMLNIFTLVVIMIMTFEAVISKRAIIKKDKVSQAYNTIKLRITFVSVLICILMMFLGLPLISYIPF